MSSTVLPLNIPRREFWVYSWFVLFQAQARLALFCSVREGWTLTGCWHSGVTI